MVEESGRAAHDAHTSESMYGAPEFVQQQNVTQTGANDQKKVGAGADASKDVTSTDTNASQTPHGTVLFERSLPPVEEAKPEDGAPAVPKLQERKVPEVAAADVDVKVEVSDAERSALTFVAYDLDAHLVPARSEMVMRATFSVRNDGRSR